MTTSEIGGPAMATSHARPRVRRTPGSRPSSSSTAPAPAGGCGASTWRGSATGSTAWPRTSRASGAATTCRRLTVDETADLVAELIETRVPAGRAHVVGLSWGGGVTHTPAGAATPSSSTGR